MSPKHDYSVRLRDVNIETHNLCTRKCSYCKFGESRPWKKKWMKEEIVDKVISDLSDVDYDGLLAFHNNNEPLLDKRIASFIGKANRDLPKATMYMFTNGDLLDRNVATGLFNVGLRYIYLSVHELRQYPNAKAIQDFFGDDRICISTEFQEEKEIYFHNRGGNLQSDEVNQTKKENVGCELPFGQAIINPDGDMIICCCDFYYDVAFENVRERSVADIFYNSPRLNQIRAQLAENRRTGLMLCENCSHHGKKIYPKCRADNFFERQKKNLVFYLRKIKMLKQ